METRDITLPNGKVITDVPVGTSITEVRESAIRAGLATPEDFVATQPSEELVPSSPVEAAAPPQQEEPWYTPKNIENYLMNNMGLPAGIAGGITGGLAAGAVGGGPIGAFAGAAVGGALGAFGGSLGSDAYNERDLDYAKALTDAAISVSFDVATLGAGKVLKVIKAKRALGVPPDQAAQEILEGLAKPGTKESLMASQNILRGCYNRRSKSYSDSDP